MFSAGLDEKEKNPVAGRFMPVSPDSAAKEIQKFIDKLISEGKNLAVIPEGPYCTPVCPPLP
jgi:F420-0:gamma-glutamyl ligase